MDPPFPSLQVEFQFAILPLVVHFVPQSIPLGQANTQVGWMAKASCANNEQHLTKWIYIDFELVSWSVKHAVV